MGGQLGRHRALDLLEGGVAVAGGEVGEQRADPAQGAAGALHRHDRVGEGWRRERGGPGSKDRVAVHAALVAAPAASVKQS